MNLIIGSHVSYNNKSQLLGSVKEALSYKANTFMFYTEPHRILIEVLLKILLLWKHIN